MQHKVQANTSCAFDSGISNPFIHLTGCAFLPALLYELNPIGIRYRLGYDRAGSIALGKGTGTRGYILKDRYLQIFLNQISPGNKGQVYAGKTIMCCS